jgi:hypothetical protein
MTVIEGCWASHATTVAVLRSGRRSTMGSPFKIAKVGPVTMAPIPYPVIDGHHARCHGGGHGMATDDTKQGLVADREQEARVMTAIPSRFADLATAKLHQD